jgi:ribonuclease E
VVPAVPKKKRRRRRRKPDRAAPTGNGADESTLSAEAAPEGESGDGAAVEDAAGPSEAVEGNGAKRKRRSRRGGRGRRGRGKNQQVVQEGTQPEAQESMPIVAESPAPTTENGSID